MEENKAYQSITVLRGIRTHIKEIRCYAQGSFRVIVEDDAHFRHT